MWPSGALKLTSRTAWTTARRCASRRVRQPALARRRGDERSGDAADLDHRPGSDAFAWAARKDTNAGGRGTLGRAAGVDRQRIGIGRRHRRSGRSRRACSRSPSRRGRRWRRRRAAPAARAPWRRARRGAAASPDRCRRSARASPTGSSAACRTRPAPRRAARPRRASRTCAAKAVPNSLPGLSALARQARHVLGADDREVHAGRRAASPCADRCVALRPTSAGVVAARRRVDRLGQRRGERRRSRAAPRTAPSTQLARQREPLFGAGQRMQRLRPSRGRPCSSAAQSARRSGCALAHAGSAAQASSRRSNAAWLSVEKLAGKHHVGRRHAVDHGAPHASAGTGAASRARPACRTSRRSGRSRSAPSWRRTASRSCDRDRRREEAEVAFRLQVGLLQQRRLALREQALLRARARPARRAVSSSGSLQSSGAERPVPRWSTKTMSRRLFRRANSAITCGASVDRALPGTAGEKEHRVGQLAARHRRNDDVVDLEAAALGVLGIERPLDAAAQHAVAKAGDVAFAQPAGGASAAAAPRRSPRAPAAVAAAAASERRRRGLIRRGFASARRWRSAPRSPCRRRPACP